MNVQYTFANYLLGIVFVGLLISFPYEQSFWGGFFFSLCCAAFIGGVADWFAVNALFRKPLNISSHSFGFKQDIIRTNIIAKNRKRIFRTLRDMVNNEVLTKEQLYTRLNHVHFSQILLAIYQEEKNQEKFYAFLKEIIQHGYHVVDEERMLHFMQQLQQQEKTLSMSTFLAKTLSFCVKEGYLEKGMTFICKILQEILSKEDTVIFLEKMIQSAKDSYVQKNEARKNVNSFIIEGFMQISSQELAYTAQRYLLQQLKELEEVNHPYRLRLHTMCINIVRQLEEDEKVKTKIEGWKNELFAFFLLDSSGIDVLREKFKKIRTPELLESITVTIEDTVKNQIMWFSENQALKSRVDAFVRKNLTHLINKQHEKLDQLIRQKLDSLSNDDLVKLIEEKAGNDLQMIRINGTLVGGVLGVIIYLVTYGWL